MSVPTDDTATKEVAFEVQSGGHLIKATVVGAVLAAVLGWTLLSAGLSLPFMLGLFFFMLFGMVIGATVFRFAAPARPVPKSRIMVMTGIVSLICWTVALTKECIEYPQDFVSRTLKNKSIYIPQGAYDKVQGELKTFIDAYLDEQYPPGGAIGYLRLVASGRPIELDIPSQPRSLKLKQRVAAWVWWTRVILALVLMYITVYAVTADLIKESDTPRPRSGAEPT